MTRYFAIFLIALLFLTACGGSDSDEGENLAGENEESSAPPPAEPNVTVSTHYFGQNGNLWKPRGDDHGSSPGNLVVLLSSQFTQQFDNCELVLRSGETAQLICINNVPWTHTPYSCFANGNRQHWRANFTCGQAAEVKVTCRRPNEEAIFTLPEASRGQVCSRHG